MKLYTKLNIYYSYICRMPKNIPFAFAFSSLGRAWALGILSVIGMKFRSLYEANCDGENPWSPAARLKILETINVLRNTVLNKDLVSMFYLWALQLRKNIGTERPNQLGELTFRFLKPAPKTQQCYRRVKFDRHFLLIIGLFVFGTIQAQNKFDIKPIEIGDTIPDVLWKMSFPIVNSPNGKSSMKLDDFRDKKLIILDFWATWCGSCIVNMPRMHKMESEIDGVKFIPITFEPKNKTARFIKTNHITDSLNIYSIVEDKQLSKYFPHRYLPHYVWVSTDGVVRAITEGRQVTSENIQRMLTSPNKTKLAKMEEMDKNRAFLLSDDVIGKGLESYSIFMKGMRPEYTLKFFQRNKNGIINGRCHINATLKSMYEMVTYELLSRRGIIFNSDTDIIIDVKKPENLDFRLTGINKRNPDRQSLKYKWEEDNVYSYDVILPLDKASALYEHIISLINDSTPYNATIEKRMIGAHEKFILIIKDDLK